MDRHESKRDFKFTRLEERVAPRRVTQVGPFSWNVNRAVAVNIDSPGGHEEVHVPSAGGGSAGFSPADWEAARNVLRFISESLRF